MNKTFVKIQRLVSDEQCSGVSGLCPETSPKLWGEAILWGTSNILETPNRTCFGKDSRSTILKETPQSGGVDCGSTIHCRDKPLGISGRYARLCLNNMYQIKDVSNSTVDLKLYICNQHPIVNFLPERSTGRLPDRWIQGICGSLCRVGVGPAIGVG